MPTPASSWMDSQPRIDQAELARLSHFSSAELDELVGHGALVPLLSETGGGSQFNAGCVAPLREAARLRTDLHLDLLTVSLLLRYLQRIAHLEQQLRALHPHPPHPQVLPREGPTPWREPHA